MLVTKLIENPQFLEKKKHFFLQVNKDKNLEWTEIFQNDHPVFLEIGSGKGEFISEYALLHSDWNFIGFELKQKRVEIILRKLNLEKHNNVRVATIKIDAEIEKIIQSGSVAGVFIQHPDPWPKRKHFKRRLVQQDLIDALSKIIIPKGFIQISTDHAEYANWIWKEFSLRRDFKSNSLDGISESPLLDEHVVTFYEREQRRLGFAPRHMLFEKI